MSSKELPNKTIDAEDYERLKASLVSLISHELRTPLTYVSASVEMIEISLDNPDMKGEIRRFLGIIDQGVKQLNETIDELLAFSNLESNLPEKTAPQIQEGVNLKELIVEIVNILKASLQSKKQVIEVAVQDDLPVLTTDQGKLSEIILQLLSNAIKFTPNEGHIRIMAMTTEQMSTIIISDNGPGIPAEVREKVFNPFYQLEDYLIREHGGLGLGLTLVQRYCNLIGAKLTLKSEVGEPGTLFEIRLPLVNPSYNGDLEMDKIMQEMQQLSKAHAEKEAQLSTMKSQLINYAKDLQTAYQTTEKKQQEIEGVYIDLMNGFAAALEAKDPYTRGRSQRLARYAQLVAKELDLDSAQQEYLHKGCLLCDVGYIGISDEILHKDDFHSLTPEEKQHIQNHPKIGAQMLQNIEALAPIVPLVLASHENWDGTGYPNRLKSEEIPYLARIIHLVDAFDAMLSDRSYRKRFTPEYALQEINKCSGTQFDPELVKLFSRLWESGQLQELISELEQKEKGNRV